MNGRTFGDIILELRGISLSFGGVKALTDISFDVREHEIRAIIGPNGAGKSSMLNVINGVYSPQQAKSCFGASTRSAWIHTVWRPWGWLEPFRVWRSSRA